MPVYNYVANDRIGQRVCGTLAADTPAAARRALREQGLALLDFTQAAFRVPRLSVAVRQRRAREEAADFARQVALLLRTGIPVVEALDVLIRQQRGKLLAVLRDVKDCVAGGMRFSEALGKHPAWFDEVFCSAIKVGQLSGHMEQALCDLAEYLQERQGLRNRLFAALAYPLILAVLGVAVVIFLMSYVVPQLLSVLKASGRPLPATTVILKALSDALVSYWPALGVAVPAAILAGAGLYRWDAARRWLHSSQLRLPLCGPLIRKSVVAQFSQMMALLLKSGVTFLEALRLVRTSSRHMVLAAELEAMESAIRRGSDIAPTLAESRIFPPLVLHIFHVGQKTGELTEMLTQLKESYATEVRVAVGRFSAALEPAMIVIMSALVGFVVFATMMPILEATRAIQ